MIIGLTGYAQSGKDTVAKILVERYGFTRIAFADKIKEVLLELDPIMYSGGRLSVIVKDFGWEVAKTKPEVRRLLQTLGVSLRNHIDESVWINATFRPYDFTKKNVVVSDVRFENEARMVKTMGGQLWRIKRLGIDAVNAHVSETQMDGYNVDQIFVNNGTIEDLESLVKTRMNGFL